MTLLQLRYFTALARLCNFSKTAEELSVSQPTLSYAIKELENELGVPLFHRNSHQVELTDYGKLFSTSIIEALETIDSSVAMLENIKANQPVMVGLGYFQSLASLFVPAFIKKFDENEDAPKNVRFSFKQGSSETLIKSLIKKEISFAILSKGSTVTEIIEIGQQRMFLLVPKNHRFAGLSFIELGDCIDEHFIFISKPSHFREFIDSAFDKLNYIPDIRYEVKDINTSINLVGIDDCICIVPYTKIINQNNLTLIPLFYQGVQLVRPIYLAWLKEKHLSREEEYIKKIIIDELNLNA